MWGCTLIEAQARCDSRQFAEWQAYYELEPWGEDRADLRAGIVAAAVCNASGNYRRTAKAADFMPDFDRQPRKRQTPQEMHDVLTQLMKRQQAQKRRRA